MNSRSIIFSLIFWMFYASQGFASAPGDTAKASKPANITYMYTEDMVAPFNQWQRKQWIVDTTLRKLEVFTSHYNLGNTGTPNVPLIFQPGVNPLGFFYSDDHISQSYFSDSSIRYFNTRAPYTSFYYVSDPQIHQFFHLCHAQNIGKHFDFALEFQRTRSDGTYINQGTNNNQITLAINYHVKRYKLFVNAMYGVYKIDQNGGIAADSDFANPNYFDRSTIPVYLQVARTTIRDKSIHLKQYYFFGFNKNDSMRNVPTMYISHSFRMGGHSDVYSDAEQLNTSFYPNIFKDSAATYDSLSYNEMNNDISIGTAKGWPAFLRWEAGMDYQWVHYLDSRTDSIFTNYIAHACIYDTGRFLYNVQGKEIFAGIQKGDMQVSAQIGFKIDSLRTIRLGGVQSLQTPPLQYELYYGNNLQWLHNFNKTTTSTASLIYNDPKWRLNIVLSASQVTNMTYLSTNAMPDQYNQTMPILTAEISKEFTLGKWHLNTRDIYQYVQDGLPMRLPEFVSENTFFFESPVFHHNMLLRIGVDVWYNTAYYANAYMPIVDQYYLQNQSLLGNYAYVDPFIAFRVKVFRMFIKYENVGSQWLGQGYFYALNYPMNDRVLRFGISWDFWN